MEIRLGGVVFRSFSGEVCVGRVWVLEMFILEFGVSMVVGKGVLIWRVDRNGVELVLGFGLFFCLAVILV